MPKLVLCQGNAVALYHGRKQMAVWLIADADKTPRTELVEQVRNYNPNSEK